MLRTCMKPITSISDYISAIKSFRQKIDAPSNLLFRGQSNSEWNIESSLERCGIDCISFKDYYTSIDYLKPEVNSYGHKFERKIIAPKGYDSNFTDFHTIDINGLPEIQYMTYLRHHGFPSPLVDVSKSEYIALFFACEDVVQNKLGPNGKVFVLQENLWNVHSVDYASIYEIGHYIETDSRHIVQQSEYLVTTRFDTKEEMWFFDPFSLSSEKLSSYIEIEIDASAKADLLNELDKMNINHYTLYQDEDSLMRKLQFEFLQNRGIFSSCK